MPACRCLQHGFGRGSMDAPRGKSGGRAGERNAAQPGTKEKPSHTPVAFGLVRAIAQTDGGRCKHADPVTAGCAHCGRSAVVTLLLGLAGVLQGRTPEQLAEASGGGGGAAATTSPSAKAQRGTQPAQYALLHCACG